MKGSGSDEGSGWVAEAGLCDMKNGEKELAAGCDMMSQAFGDWETSLSGLRGSHR
ncbi:MAG TPA: hypothetical protein PLF16_01070 [Candidatus Staskawiczbacteria bacterium]|nr:hypothetical protein [Candidatus Staskawiczbacteria bacterium]